MIKTNKYGQQIFPAFDFEGRFYYYTYCYECKQKVVTNLHQRNIIYCERCKAEKRVQETYDKSDDRQIGYEIRFQRGVSFLESKVENIAEYADAIEKAKSRIRRYGSKDEVIAAIVLIKSGYSIIPQQRIGRYIVDFVLPDEKVIIEIDGYPFHLDKNREKKRDNEISLKMGVEWSIIHVPTRLLERSPLSLSKVIENKDNFFRI